jgi:P-loop containing dynein motor region D4
MRCSALAGCLLVVLSTFIDFHHLPRSQNCVVFVSIGIGGSGRQSATKLAAYMTDYDLFQIEISRNYTTNEWREDMKKVCSVLDVAWQRLLWSTGCFYRTVFAKLAAEV